MDIFQQVEGPTVNSKPSPTERWIKQPRAVDFSLSVLEMVATSLTLLFARFALNNIHTQEAFAWAFFLWPAQRVIKKNLEENALFKSNYDR